MARHPVDLLSFVSGVLVLGFGLLLLSGGVDSVPMEWAGPAVAIGLGMFILVAARPQRQPREDEPSSSVEG
jgi:TRAP-type C4-dicarboxylate transport system permease small subunit